MAKPYSYQKGKFVIPLEDIDPLQYLGSKATASVPTKDLTPEAALEVLKHNPKEFKKAPWSVKHNILTALLGGGAGMGAGAGIGRLFKRHRPFSTAVGGLLGLGLGSGFGDVYSSAKTIKKVEQLAKQKKLKTASFQAAFFDELEKIAKTRWLKELKKGTYTIEELAKRMKSVLGPRAAWSMSGGKQTSMARDISAYGQKGDPLFKKLLRNPAYRDVEVLGYGRPRKLPR